MKKKLILTAAFLVCVAIRIDATSVANIPDPETYFGHQPGADFKLIRWEKIVDYYRLLGNESDRIEVVELGKTTLGNPFLLAMVSSPENLAQKDKYKEIAKKLAQGRVSEEEAVLPSAKPELSGRDLCRLGVPSLPALFDRHAGPADLPGPATV